MFIFIILINQGLLDLKTNLLFFWSLCSLPIHSVFFFTCIKLSQLNALFYFFIIIFTIIALCALFINIKPYEINLSVCLSVTIWETTSNQS